MDVNNFKLVLGKYIMFYIFKWTLLVLKQFKTPETKLSLLDDIMWPKKVLLKFVPVTYQQFGKFISMIERSYTLITHSKISKTIKSFATRMLFINDTIFSSE